ncbi:MAG: hypothetical protein KDI98_04595, partial [Hyphomicrobiaceae bacterium]|nr:hypothetical protein [Hyphomicrobiaceae bacterium]
MRLAVLFLLACVVLFGAAVAGLALFGPVAVPSVQDTIARRIAEALGPETTVTVEGGSFGLNALVPVFEVERISIERANARIDVERISGHLTLGSLMRLEPEIDHVYVGSVRVEADLMAAVAAMAAVAEPSESRRFDQLVGGLAQLDDVTADLEAKMRAGGLPAISLSDGLWVSGDRERRFSIAIGLTQGHFTATATMEGDQRSATAVLWRAETDSGRG